MDDKDLLKTAYAEHKTWAKIKKQFPNLGVQEAYDIIFSPVKTALCGKNKEFRNFTRGYAFCEKNCSCSNLAKKATNMERYGVESALKSPFFKEKVQKTNLNRYGGISPLSNPLVREKIKRTVKERYGVDHILQVADIQERIKHTNIDKYGSENVFASDEIKNRIKQTNIEKYGYDNPSKSPVVRRKVKETTEYRYGKQNVFQLDEVKEKIRNTNFERYGDICAMRSPDVKNRTRETNIAKWGVPATSQRHYSQETISILNDKQKFLEMLDKYSVKTVSALLNVDAGTVYDYRIRYGLEKTIKSSYEVEIANWLSELGIDFSVNNRKIIPPRELDIFIPSHLLALEFNGLYWHSSFKLDKNYHKRKYEACMNAGVRLIMINSDEWDHRSETIKSTIRHAMGLSVKGNAARKLSIKKISGGLANSFFDNYHIQGRTSAIIYALGAFDEYDNLVGSMAFSRQRGTGKIELIRFCSDNSSRAGLFSRLFRRAIFDEKYTEVLSFADLRYATGSVYLTNGFVLSGKIPPDYRYVIKGKTFHKSSYTKKRIETKFNKDVSEMTEQEAMAELGIPRIYDCGKLKFIWKAG